MKSFIKGGKIMGFVLAALSTEIPPTWFVIALGIAVVFVGLICIVGIIKIMNLLTSGTVKVQIASSEAAPTQAAPAQAPVATTAPVAAPIENRGEIIAAVCAAVAEENGTDVSAIRVISFKKL